MCLLGVGVDELMFGLAGDDLDMDVILSRKEQALPDREVGETFALFFGELKDVAKYVHGT